MELNLRLSKAKAFLQTRASSKKSCSARTARGACSPSQCGKCIGGRFQGGEAILDLCTADLIVTAAGVLDACHVGGECIAPAPHSAAGKALRVASAALQDCSEHRHDYRCHCPCECHDADASGADCDDRLRAAKSKGQNDFIPNMLAQASFSDGVHTSIRQSSKVCIFNDTTSNALIRFQNFPPCPDH